ncbi:MAG: hypothetical protein JOZ52_14260 [Acidobacteria bacterium]|nr:hypothetical protein [Acidobacteriota bacterium]
MNRLVLVLMACVLLMSCCFAAAAQDDKSGSKKKPQKFYHNANIETSYDKEKDETKVELKRMSVSVVTFPNDPQLHLTAYFTYAGKNRSKPESVVLGFVAFSINHVWKFKEDRELVAMLGDEKLKLGSAELLDSSNKSDYVKEVMAMYVPFDAFVRIVNFDQNRVNLQLGNVKFELKKNELEALRDLASRAEP